MTTKAIFNKSKQRRTNHAMDQNEVKSQQPIIPMSKVCLDVIRKLQTQPYPQLTLATHSTINEALQLYYNEYVRLFRQNQVLNDQLASILSERNILADQFNQIKKMKSYDDNIRRRRRYASEIQRNYHCPMPKCNKGYGSEGSLTHHVRLKHPKFFESGEYEIYLETYILPKQEIKNQDKDGHIAINVQEFKSLKEKRQNTNSNKIQTIDQDAKQAKSEQNLTRNIQPNNKNPTATVTTSQNQRKLQTPQTILANTLIKEVDGYIFSERNNQQQLQGSKKQKGNQKQNPNESQLGIHNLKEKGQNSDVDLN